MRGNLAARVQPHVKQGSIPAGAGEPNPPLTLAGVYKVYPRGCGGTQGWKESNPRLRGLSPRVRGNPGRANQLPMRGGSIPAGAGEPPHPDSRLPLPGVYPRGCGGTPTWISPLAAMRGLSPRVRGNHQLQGCQFPL